MRVCLKGHGLLQKTLHDVKCLELLLVNRTFLLLFTLPDGLPTQMVMWSMVLP